MRTLLERQIESDEYGYYCIDTHIDLIDYPFCGYGYTEQEAVKDAERQARLYFNRLTRGESVASLK